jgi:trehalose 6-phosphate synthase/phosphatase
MQAYTDNIDGSFIEVRQSCIVWNYRNAEMEHGNMFIHDLYSQIEKTIKGTSTEIIYGNGYLEVKPLGIEKVSFCFIF